MGFTLDPSRRDFVLSRPALECPSRGPYSSHVERAALVAPRLTTLASWGWLVGAPRHPGQAASCSTQGPGKGYGAAFRSPSEAADNAALHTHRYYSLNDAREPDWPEGLRRWVSDAKRGEVPSGTKFSSRYVCALVADVHRTLIRGGWAGNPRPHLRLLYEAMPLAHIAEACGGKASDGVRDILDIEPTGLHDRLPVFIGSAEDVAELVAYGDVQQGATAYTD